MGDSSQSASLFDPLGGYYLRVSLWLGVARFLNLLISASSVEEIAENYLNWRLVGGIIDLIDTEYQRFVRNYLELFKLCRNRLSNIGFLLVSLSTILHGILKKDDTNPRGQVIFLFCSLCF